MARGKGRDKRQDLKAKEPQEPVNEGGVTKDVLNDFHRGVASLKADSDKLRGEIGSDFKEFEEAGGHKWCYKVVAKLASMPEDKRKDAFLTIINYAEMLSIFAQGNFLDPTFEKIADVVKEISEETETAAAPDVPEEPARAASSTH